MELSGELWYWRGPAPHYFITVPEEQSAGLKAAAKFVTYGWGMIPVTARIGDTVWKTSLFPKNGLYLVPIKKTVRIAENLEEGNLVRVYLEVG